MTQRPAGNLLGLNILAQTVYDRAKLSAYLQQARPALVVVMDDVGLARQFKHALPNMLVVHRRSHPDQHHWHEKISAAQWLADHRADAGDGLILQCFNEPGTQDYKALADWCVELMQLADSEGVPLALPNFSVGNPNERRIQTGEFDDLLKAFAKYPRHYLALHEYAQASPSLEQPYHIGRYREWIARAQALGIRPPRILITETGRDVGGGHRDGWRSVLTEAQYVTFLHRLADAYRPDNIPTAIFCYGTGGGGDWQYFDLQGADAVLAALPIIGKPEEQATPMPDYPFPPSSAAWQRGTFASRADYANVRAQPATSATIAGRLDKTPQTGAWVATDVVEAAGTWHALKLDSGTQGYVRADVVLFEAAPAPEPEPPTVPEPGTIYSAFLTKDEIVQLADLYEAAATIYRAAADRITVTEVQHLGVSASSAKESLVMPETPVTPVLGPILAMLRSRKFIIALASFLISLLTMAVPELAEVRESLLTVTIVLGLALIGGITLEDAAKAGKQEGPAAPALPPADALLELVKAALEAYFDRAELEVVELSPEEVDTIAESVRVKLAATPKPDGALG
jgi:hypothetical protein